MADISKIPTDEMVDDYYASLLEWKTCEKLLAGFVDSKLAQRSYTNYQIMVAIEDELEKRGELDRIGKGEKNDNERGTETAV